MKRQSKYIITNKNVTSLQYVSPINDSDDESEEMEEGESEEAAAALEREGPAVTECEKDIEEMERVPETEEMEILEEQDDVLAEESMGGRGESSAAAEREHCSSERRGHRRWG